MFKETATHLELCHVAKTLSFTNEIELDTRRPILREMLKGILQAEGK
jgi:hypothetical protein